MTEPKESSIVRIIIVIVVIVLVVFVACPILSICGLVAIGPQVSQVFSQVNSALIEATPARR